MNAKDIIRNGLYEKAVSFMDRKVIATCDKRGNAELIRYELDKHYKVLTDDDRPDHSIYFLAVAQ